MVISCIRSCFWHAIQSAFFEACAGSECPYIACESLQKRIDRTCPQKLVDILRIRMKAANGLAAAQGLVHRDVMPANILLEIGVDAVLAVPLEKLRDILPETVGNLPTVPNVERKLGPATFMKNRWRSAIVDIAVYGNSDVLDGRQERVIGRGVVASKDGLVLTHLSGVWANWLKDWKVLAKFDDGSQVHLSVAKEGGAGLVALKPIQAVSPNHHFPISQATFLVGDELYVGQSGDNVFDKTTLVQADRKVATGTSSVWQLQKHGQTDILGGQPVLSSTGELVGLTLQGTGELLLAVPASVLH